VTHESGSDSDSSQQEGPGPVTTHSPLPTPTSSKAFNSSNSSLQPSQRTSVSRRVCQLEHSGAADPPQKSPPVPLKPPSLSPTRVASAVNVARARSPPIPAKSPTLSALPPRQLKSGNSLVSPSSSQIAHILPASRVSLETEKPVSPASQENISRTTITPESPHRVGGLIAQWQRRASGSP
jgi:hypothetical protein